LLTRSAGHTRTLLSWTKGEKKNKFGKGKKKKKKKGKKKIGISKPEGKKSGVAFHWVDLPARRG
jgi:hypothetical protein